MRALLLTLVAASSVAQAQYTNTLTGRQFSNMYAANADFLMTQMIQNANFQSMMASSARKKAAPVAPATTPPPPTYRFPLSATDFKPAGPRTVPEQLAASAPKPEDRAQLLALCRTIQQAIEAQPDVRKNNLATAMTVLLGASIQVVADRDLSDAESDALLRTVNDTLAATPALKTMSAQKRTAAYDAFLVTGGLIAGIAQNAKESGDATQLALAQDMAISTLVQFGFKGK